jgi:hypothetical protein
LGSAANGPWEVRGLWGRGFKFEKMAEKTFQTSHAFNFHDIVGYINFRRAVFSEKKNSFFSVNISTKSIRLKLIFINLITKY